MIALRARCSMGWFCSGAFLLSGLDWRSHLNRSIDFGDIEFEAPFGAPAPA